MNSFARSDRYCLSIFFALLTCCIRLALYDYRFFELTAIPHHDILSAAGPFASSMHSMRISGDIAWWLPSLAYGGSAQYFIHFIGPLAPTAGHVPFMFWAEMVRFMSYVGIAVPEFFQFLAFHYVLAPVLAYTAFFLLVQRLCGSWRGAAFALLVYALGAPGIWNNAWMYHQEWFTVFALMWAFDKAIADPRASSLAVLGIALVNYVSSLSYWSVFSSWFLLFFFLAHVLLQRKRWLEAIRYVFLSSSPAGRVVGGFCAALLVGWVTLAGFVYIEQSKVYVRGGTEDSSFSVEEVVERAKERNALDLMRLGDFVPHDTEIPAHDARYIGLLTVFLAIFSLMRMKHKETKLAIFLLLGSLSVVAALPPFRAMFEITPGMKSIRHVFYFYIYYVQVCVIILSAIGLEALLLFIPKRARVIVLMAILTVATVDMGRYYVSIQHFEQRFALNWRVPGRGAFSPEQDWVAQLGKVWAPAWQIAPADAGLIANMPIATEFFPVLWFSRAVAASKFELLPSSEQAAMTPPGLLGFAAGLHQDNIYNTEVVDARIMDFGYNHFVADVSVPALGSLVINILPDPAWTFEVDGKAVETRVVNYRMVAITLSAGLHQIRASYWPKSRYFYTALKPLTFVFLLVAVASLFITRAKVRGLERQDLATF